MISLDCCRVIRSGTLLPWSLRDARLAIHATLTAAMRWLAVTLALLGDTFGTSFLSARMAALATEPV